MTPHSGHNKTAGKAVLQGSMFTKRMCDAHSAGQGPAEPPRRRFEVIIPCFKEVFGFVKKVLQFRLAVLLGLKNSPEKTIVLFQFSQERVTAAVNSPVHHYASKMAE